MPGIVPVVSPNPPGAPSDLPAGDYPDLDRIVRRDRVGPIAANRQPKSLERRTVSLAQLVQSITVQLNNIDKFYLRRDGSPQTTDGSNPASGVTADVSLNGHVLTNSGAPTNADHLTRKDFVENAIAAADATLSAALNALIDAEEAARLAADAVLQANITAEQNARAAADTTLQTNITNEQNTRAAADTTLQTNINTEQSARIAADSALQATDSSLQAQITTMQTDTTLNSCGARYISSNLPGPTDGANGDIWYQV